ncbi:MAG: UvrD-helicase domain-containing protein [Planctomycetota bacterium]
MSGSLWRHPRGQRAGELAGLERALLDSLAGTGKTETAAELCLAHVLEHGVRPDRIRLLTFNEKAASEGRDRVRRVAERLLRPPARVARPDEPCFVIDAAARAALEGALREPPVVTTIHAFAQEVLARHAFEAGLPQHLALTGRGEAFHAAFLDFVRRELAARQEAELEVWLGQRRLARLEQLLAKCTNEEPTTELRPAFDPELPLRALRDAAALPERFWRALEGAVHAQRWGSRWKVRYKLADLCASWPARARRLAGSGARLAPHEPDLAACLRYLLAEAPVPPDEAQGFEVLAALQRLQVGFDAAAARLWAGPMGARYREHKRVRGQVDFDDLLRLLDEALARPGGAALRERVRALCDVVIVDECQDQNVTIYGRAEPGGGERGVFRPLFFSAGYRGKAYQSGDPHQALYGWRGADVHGGFLRARADMERDPSARVLGLRRSFRSTPRLLEAFNRLLDQDAAPPFFRGPIDYRDPAAPGRQTLRALGPDGREVTPVVVLAVEPEGDELSRAELEGAVAQGIAAELVRFREGDGGVTLVEEGRDDRALTLDDCFVIVRSHREAGVVREALAARGVPCLLHRAAKLYATPEAEDVADLLAALAEPERLDLRLRAFATPLLGVPYERLGGVRDLAPSHPLVRRWFEWVARAERGLARLLASLLDESGVAARERLGGLPGGRRAEVYQQVVDQLIERATRVPGDAARLLVHLERLRAESDRDEAPSVRQEAREPSVRVMTPFAAKGLSTGLVFLMGGFTRWGDRDGPKIYQDPRRAAAKGAAFDPEQGGDYDRPEPEDPFAPVQTLVYFDPQGTRVLHIGPLDDEAERLFAATSRQENTFLLYTALTRAAARVFVPFVPADGDGWAYPELADSYYEPLNERLDALLAEREEDAALAALLEVVPCRHEPPGEPEDPAAWARLATWEAPADLATRAPDPEPRRALIRAHRAQQAVSYSSLKKGQLEASQLVPAREEGATSEDPGVATEAPESGAPEAGSEGIGEALGRGRHVGNLLHAVLERCELEGLRGAADPTAWASDPQVARLLARQVEAHGFEPGVVPAVRDAVFHTLTRTVDLGGRLLRLADCEPLRREVDFRVVLPGTAGSASLGAGAPALERGFLHGAIDALTRLPGVGGGPPVLVGIDWKSDSLPDYAPATVRQKTQQDYDLQVMAYSYVLAKLAGVRDPGLLDGAIDVRMVYVYLRGTGLPGGAPSAGIAVYRLTPAAFREYERFLAEVAG